MNKGFYLLLLMFVIHVSCKDSKSKNTTKDKPIASFENGLVVSAREEASKIGVDIMKQGGNAFDAMLATHFALAVTYPYAGNLGGGGFLVYRLENTFSETLDFREKAPLAATRDMYLDKDGNIIENLSTQGALAIGVPGSVEGVFTAHAEFGLLPVETILKPVIALAENGFIVTEKQAARFKKYDSIFKVVNEKPIIYNATIKQGDTLKNIKLAETLKRISKYGYTEFYTGKTADILIDEISEKGGIITHEDLKQYESKWRKPLTFNYKDLRIISMAPPSSGGICLGQILKTIEPYDLKSYGHNSKKMVQVFTEAARRSYADRSFFLGDPDFIDIPKRHLLSDVYLEERMKDFNFNKATSSDSTSFGMIEGYSFEASDLPLESNETTHYSIVDQHGNAISVTTTLNGAYGSKLFIEELGFFLNNEMDDFSSKPGEPNLYGLVGAEANSIEPKKRMLSSMTPTIVEKDGDLWMIVGTPGGSTIITTVAQVILNVEEYGMTMQEAVDAPRFHHQWLPDQITFEPDRFNKSLLNQLKSLGYKTVEKTNIITGKVDAILVREDGTYEAGADSRGDDTAKGY
ncbi:gamma-glutamyltransferase [Ichthyenterobacterium sp. W332]|uniref:Glutathione hydrolase proenzyme n=1 Tax=Microcosmobacter mediterraneus TaxID=3075607 RepID=A0ABU2YH36_9FLAO|nr:gamma-glutamyltransferase [Ichthyenterobacterium sp. W332]MDT0557484.1 gamma-glutamyltransferase [Ichthyenterobacterium sp. W332]